jgi:glycosyltransferase involved in cell wall biosynthesis
MTGRGTVVIVSPYDGKYGPRRSLDDVAQAVRQAGLEPLYVLPPTAMLDGLDPPPHLVHGLATIPRTRNPAKLSAFLRSHLRATAQIERIANENDAVMIYSISEAAFCGALAGRRLGLPTVVHVIGMSIKSPRWVARAFVPLLDRLTDRFIACSSAVAEMLAGLGVDDDRISVVHNGVSAAGIDETAHLESPIDHPGPRIGMVAAYDARKGHELFVQAAARIAERHPDARFYLIGGPLEGRRASSDFERQIVALVRSLGLEDRFNRPGYRPHPEVYRWIRALDIVVVPSETEAFAHVLLEAMVCGRAVVATAIEGNLDAFVDGYSGRYSDSTPTALSGIVCELIEDPVRRAELGAAARERARMLFDTNVTLPALAEAVDDLLVRHRAVPRGV